MEDVREVAVDIRVECEYCGVELDIVWERTDRGTVWVAVEPHTCEDWPLNTEDESDGS